MRWRLRLNAGKWRHFISFSLSLYPSSTPPLRLSPLRLSLSLSLSLFCHSIFRSHEQSYLLYRYDYLEIYDGGDEVSDKIGRFCGVRSFAPFVSSGRELLLKFRSDDTVSWKGFLAQYYVVDPLSEESVSVPQVPSNQTAVGSKPKPTSNIETDGAAPVDGTAAVVNTRQVSAGHNTANQDGPFKPNQSHRRQNKKRRRRHRRRRRRRRQ